MTRTSWKRAAVLLIAGAAFTPAVSRAGFVVDFNGAIDNGGGSVRYTYDVELVDDGVVDPTDGIADFFTLYDVFGIVPGSIKATGLLGTAFRSSLQFVGVTALNTTPADDPDLRNLTFTYDGAAVLDAGEDGNELSLVERHACVVGSDGRACLAAIPRRAGRC